MTCKEIKYESPEAAHYEEKGLWFASNGIGYDTEHMARWAGCTHVKCNECEQYTNKMYTLCEDCRVKSKLERYYKLPEKEWDCENFVYSGNYDQFFNFEELLDYTNHHNISSEDMQLVICEPEKLSTIDEDYWSNDLPEDGELPESIVQALDNLNKIINQCETLSWMPGKYRVKSCTIASDCDMI